MKIQNQESYQITQYSPVLSDTDKCAIYKQALYNTVKVQYGDNHGKIQQSDCLKQLAIEQMKQILTRDKILEKIDELHTQYQQKQKKLQELETRVNVMQATEKDELQKQEQELKQAQTEFQQASELWQKTAEQAKLVQDKNR